ncbi:MAG: hypothetical protein HRT88_07445 [Lentisphaeraceae bacterium]|nr:hypothetical protein [Lentisphaeraceae bacterium]
MINRRILSWTSALLLSGVSLFAEIAIEEGSTKKVENTIEVAGPLDRNVEIKRVKPDDITFIDGDFFKGSLVSVDDKELTWNHPHAKSDIIFDNKNLDTINFGHIPVSLKPSGVSNISLTNGDRLFGLITELNEDYLILETWYAGTLKIERLMVQSIAAGGAVNKAIYEGPTNISEWTLSKSTGWEIKNGALVSKSSYASAGKDVKIPDKSNIEFDVHWHSRLRLTVSFYASRLRQSSGEAYQLEFNDNYCYVNRRSDREGQDRLGQSFRLEGLKPKFKVSIRTDKEKKQIIIMIDNKVVYTVSDTKDFISDGTSLVFYTQQGNVKLSSIIVTEWSGGTGAQESPEAKVKDAIVFVNKDSITGNLKSIQKGKILFETPFAPLTIPLERISSISLGLGEEEERPHPRRNPNDIKLFFGNEDGRVTLNLQNISNGKISGGSENFGDAKFNMLAFEKLEFNIYADKKTDADESEDEW